MGELNMMPMTKISIGIVFLFFYIPQMLYCQDVEQQVKNIDSLYFESPALFNCFVQFPEKYQSNKSYPLIIALHGGGGTYASFKKIWCQFDNPQFIMATPQAPYKWLMENKIGYDWSGWPSGELEFMQEAIKLNNDFIANLLKQLTTKYNIKDVYLLGFSQGSIIAQIAGINNHELLNGIIILSGPEINHPDKPEIVWPEEEVIKLAKHLKVFIAHSKSDKFVEFDFALKSKKIYEKYGFVVNFFEFDDGHKVDSNALKEIEKWIINQ